MNILILGSGGREHAFAWKIKQSQQCDQLYIAPGNAGTAELGVNLAVSVTDFAAIKAVVLEHQIGLVVVGSEVPLVDGIVDFFKADATLEQVAIIGPTKAAAQLEGSKAYAKAFMQEFGIPTAAYQAFTKAHLAAGKAFIAAQTPPIVLKADGLAAGKGVLILDDIETAQSAFEQMLNGQFGTASERVVIESFLDGIEFSVFVLTDGKNYSILPIAKDYKRIGEGDTGLNTGGMGSVSPVSFVDDELLEKVEERIIEPTIKGIQTRQLDYKGFIFFGLISVGGDPYVIEYNCRMGDPETQSVLPRLETDLVALLQATWNGTLDAMDVNISEEAYASVILVSGGYPEQYEKGKQIEGITSVADHLIFHAGTKELNGQIVTNGGRVLAITSSDTYFKAAIAKSVAGAAQIEFEGKYYRKDIGFDL